MPFASVNCWFAIILTSASVSISRHGYPIRHFAGLDAARDLAFIEIYPQYNIRVARAHECGTPVARESDAHWNALKFYPPHLFPRPGFNDNDLPGREDGIYHPLTVRCEPNSIGTPTDLHLLDKFVCRRVHDVDRTLGVQPRPDLFAVRRHVDR